MGTFGKSNSSPWMGQRYLARKRNPEDGKEEETAALLLLALDKVIDRTVQRMWDLVVKQNLQNSLHDTLQKKDDFFKEASAFLKSDPQKGELSERLSMFLGKDFYYGLTGEYLELYKETVEDLKRYNREDTHLILGHIKRVIQKSRLGLQAALDAMPSVFSMRAVLLGEEVEVLQFYVAWGVPVQDFEEEAKREKYARANKEQLDSKIMYYRRASEILEEIRQDAEGDPRKQQILQRAEKITPKSASSRDVEILESILDQARMLLGRIETTETPQKGRITIKELLEILMFRAYRLKQLPSEIHQEFMFTQESRLLFALLEPYSCVIGKMRYSRGIDGSLYLSMGNALIAGQWPLVSPKSVDVYHEAITQAFQVCEAVRNQLSKTASDIVSAQPPYRHAEQLVRDLLTAAAARQTRRKLASERNLELSDKIDVELSDTEWMQRLGQDVKPHPWQLTSTEIAANNPRVFLADPTGFGKTGQALLILERNLAYPAVIVCPPGVFQNWGAAVKQWLPHRSVSLIEGKMPESVDVGGQEIEASDVWRMFDSGRLKTGSIPADMRPKFASVSVETMEKGTNNRAFIQAEVPIDRYDTDIIIVSKDSLKGDVSKGLQGKLIPRVLKRVNAGFVFDESHYLKNRRTATYQAAKIVASQARTRLLLSATVLTNNADELRNQLEILGQLYDFFGSPQEFEEAFSSLQGGGIRGGVDRNLSEANIHKSEKVNEILRRCCYVRRFPKQLQAMGAMPKPHRITYPVFLDAVWTNTYMQSIREFQEAIVEYSREVAKLLFQSILQTAAKLIQETVGRTSYAGLKDRYSEMLDYAQGKGKATVRYKRFKDDPKELQEAVYTELIDESIQRQVNQSTLETLEDIREQAKTITQKLLDRLAESNAEFAEIIRSEQQAEEDENDDEDDEKAKEKARKKAEKAKKKAEEKNPELSTSQRKLFSACLEVFFEQAFNNHLFGSATGYTPDVLPNGAINKETDFEGDARILIDAFAKQIATSRLEGAVLNRILKMTQITSIAKAPYAAALILQMLTRTTLAPLIYHDEQSKQNAMKLSTYPLVEQGGKVFEQRPTKIVFFAQFRPTLEYVSQILTQHNVNFVIISGSEDKKAKAAAQVAFASRPEVRVCLCTIGAAREGLNLQVSDQAVFSDVSYTAASTEQAEGRIKRLGSPFPDVFFTYLIVPDSIDTLKVGLMERKREMMIGVQEGASAIKRHFEVISSKGNGDGLAVRYDLAVEGGRVDGLFLETMGPEDTQQKINPTKLAYDLSWDGVPFTEIGKAAIEAFRATGNPEPVLDALSRWKELTDAYAEDLAARNNERDKSEEETDDTEGALVESILQFMDAVPTLNLKPKDQESLLLAIDDLKTIRAEMLSARFRAKII